MRLEMTNSVVRTRVDMDRSLEMGTESIEAKEK